MVSCLAGFCLFVTGSAEALTPPVPAKAEIVYSNGGRILSMQADGSRRTVLTRPDLGEGEYDDGDESPEISPDGSKLLFIRTNEDQDDVYTYDLMVASRQGANPVSIVSGSSSNNAKSATLVESPTWSSDGQAIFYVEITYRGTAFTSRVVRVNTSGSGRRVFASKRVNYKKLESGNSKIKPRDYMYFSGVDASPDGTKLLIGKSGMFFKPGLISSLQVLNLSTNTVRTLEKIAEDGSWSPDGSQIVFTSERQRREEDCYESFCSYQSKVFVMNADGSGAHPLIRDSKAGDEESPNWSGDSSRIAFSSNRNDPEADFFSMEVYSVGTDGSCLTWLTNGSPFSGSADWAPEDLDSSPGACGSAGREPFVDSVLFVPGASSNGATYWLGPIFKGMAPLYFPSDVPFTSGFNQYGDCISYDPTVCHERTEVTVITKPTCRSQLSNRLRAGTFKGMKRKRGALLSGSVANGWSNPLISTGRSAISLNAFGPNGGIPRERAKGVYREAFEALRPAGSDELTVRFAEAKLNRNDVRAAARMAAKVKRAGSIRKLDESLKRLDARHIRAYLRFYAAIRRLGGVKTVACPVGKGYLDNPGDL